MNIGEVATRTGLPAKTIRYYEDIGLVTPRRDANGYRAFREAEVHSLAFLGRARTLGFSIPECRALLQLYQDKGRSSADVKAIAHQHLQRIDDKIAGLIEMQKTLSQLVEACAGDNRPDCPILETLGKD